VCHGVVFAQPVETRLNPSSGIVFASPSSIFFAAAMIGSI